MTDYTQSRYRRISLGKIICIFLSVIAIVVMVFSLIYLYDSMPDKDIERDMTTEWTEFPSDISEKIRTMRLLANRENREVSVNTAIDPDITRMIAARYDLLKIDITSDITDEDMIAISNSQGLKSLSICYKEGGLSEVGLKKLGDMRSLVEIMIISESNVDVILQAVRHLPRLTRLWLSGSVSRDGFNALADLDSLRYLDLSASTTSSDDLFLLAGLKSPETLDLSGLKLTDDHLRVLPPWLTLKSVTLLANPISDDGLLSIVKWRNLESLDIGATNISYHSLSSLMEFSNLKSLRLPRKGFIDKDENELRNWRPSLKVVLSGEQ